MLTDKENKFISWHYMNPDYIKSFKGIKSFWIWFLIKKYKKEKFERDKPGRLVAKYFTLDYNDKEKFRYVWLTFIRDKFQDKDIC